MQKRQRDKEIKDAPIANEQFSFSDAILVYIWLSSTQIARWSSEIRSKSHIPVPYTVKVTSQHQPSD